MRFFIFAIMFWLSSPVYPYEECGVQPAAPMGCFVGACVNGQWQVVCPDAKDKKCANSPPASCFSRVLYR